MSDHNDTTIHITPAHRGELTCRYPRQSDYQDVYIALDLRDGEMWASYDAEIGNAVPLDVWHGHVRRYPIHTRSVQDANRLMREVRRVARRVVAGYEDHWNGSNRVARLSEDAQAADDMIAEYLDRES